MTYSSRNFLISCGVGSDDRAPRFSTRRSSAMMSLQTSTHSSQMNTVGPAISLRTSFWSLLQNEHRRTSVSPLFFIVLVAGGCCATPPRPPAHFARVNRASFAARCSSFAPADHLVEDAVGLRLFRVHDEVPVGVGDDLLERLLGVEGEDLVQAVLDAEDLLGLDRDVGGLSLGASPGLVDEDARVGEGVALARGPRRGADRPHGG